MSKFTTLNQKRYDYILGMLKSNPVLRKIENTNQDHPQIHMQIAPDQAIFMQFLIQSINAKNILEIGTFQGYSAAAMALAIPDDGKVISCDHDHRIKEKVTNLWQEAGLDNKIELRIGQALEIMTKLKEQENSFDFIFIDADKRLVIDYYEMAKKLISPNGIIAVDNVLFNCEVCEDKPSKAASYMHQFNLHLQADKDVIYSLLTISDGLSIIRKKI
jgi:predicted O-methyltransferase YrrM